MKTLTHFLTSILILGLVCSCNPTIEETPFFEITSENPTDTIIFGIEGGTQGIHFSTNQLVELAVDAEWLTAKINSAGTIIAFSAEPNQNPASRDGLLTITAGTFVKKISAHQIGQTPVISLQKEAYEVDEMGGTLLVPIVANVIFNVTISPEDANWCTYEALRQGEAGVDTLQFSYAVYTEIADRSVVVTINGEQNVSAQFTLTQTSVYGRDYKPSDDIDIPTDIKLTIASGTADSFQSGEGIERSFDGDYATIYHSNWSNGGSNYFPITLTYNFSDVEEMDYFIYYPRQDGSWNGYFKTVELQIKTSSDNDFVSLGEFDFGGTSNPFRYDFEETLIRPSSIRFIVKKGMGDGQGFASCSEMEFYKKSEAGSAITDVFTDESCSELKEGTTWEDIQAIESDFFRNIARYLYTGAYPSEFRIADYKPYPWPSQGETLYCSPFNQLDNVTGISVKSGEELVVLVGNTYGANISVRIMNWPKDADDDVYNGSSFPVFTGANLISAPTDGLVYVMYHSDSATEPIRIHFATGTVNGYFDRNRHTKEDWKEILSNASSHCIDVVGHNAHLCFPVSEFRNYTPDAGQLIAAYDSLVYLERSLMGLYKYPWEDEIKNRMFYQGIYTSYMYATSYRTAYNVSTCSAILNVNSFMAEPWGPAHETGHCNQTHGLCWVGMTEVTNNIHSLQVQTSFGNTSRLLAEDRYNTMYRNVVPKTPAEMVFSTGCTDVFQQTMMFWQLQLYNAKVLEVNDPGNAAASKADFFLDLHEDLRQNRFNGNNGEQQLHFVELSCRYTGYDMRDFFREWGLMTPCSGTIDDYGAADLTVTESMVSTLNETIDAMNLPLPPHDIMYLRDDNINLFVNYLPIEEGSCTKSGQTLSLEGWKNVVMYEICQDGNRISSLAYPNSSTISGITSSTKVFAVAADGKRIQLTY